MDYPSMILNAGALVASVTALVISARLSARNAEQMRRANQLPIVLSHFKELRTNGFVEREIHMRESMADHSPDLGFTGLPLPLRVDAYEVCLYYQDLAYCIRHCGVDSALVGNFEYRLLANWAAVAAHIEGERKLRNSGADVFMGSLEELVEQVVRGRSGQPPHRSSDLTGTLRRRFQRRLDRGRATASFPTTDTSP
jgi:hypothetical protein